MKRSMIFPLCLCLCALLVCFTVISVNAGSSSAEDDEDQEVKKDLKNAKKLYHKWQRARQSLNCEKCEAIGTVPCPKCKGSGREPCGGEYKRRCRNCGGGGKLSCKTCEGNGVMPDKVKILFWDILDPEFKKQEGVEADMKEAIKRGVQAVKGSGGFTMSFDASTMTNKVGRVKDLKVAVNGDYGVARWECCYNKSTWSESIVLHKVDKNWYWLPSKSADEIGGCDGDE